MNPREKFDGLVREFAGQIVSEVLQASLADVAPAAGVRLRNDSVDGSPVEVSGRPAKRRHITLTPKRRAALKVQGRYLGLMRRFNKDGQESIKKVGREQGNAAEASAATARLRPLDDVHGVRLVVARLRQPPSVANCQELAHSTSRDPVLPHPARLVK